MRPVLAALATAILFLSVPQAATAQRLALDVNAEAAVLINADTGAVLYEKNAHAKHYPASITKIVTALVALNKVGDKMDVMITADQDCIGTVTEEAMRRSNYTLPAYYLLPDGSHIGIKKGEILSLKDLMYGMMLASGDDAANVIAKFTSETVPEFVQEMNATVKKIGCKNTTFYNPHGLHHPEQQTSAHDMALITREALKNATFREIVSTVRYARPKTNKQESTMMVQTNKLLRSGNFHYPKAIGVKTGYYSLAGSTLVAAAKDADRTLIAVLMKVQERKNVFLDAKKMFEAAFSQPKVQRILLHAGPQKYSLQVKDAKMPLETVIAENVAIDYYPAEETKIKCLLYWNKDLKLPISKGQQVGELVVQNENGLAIQKAALYAKDEVSGNLSYRVKNMVGSGTASTLFKILGVISVGAFIGIFVMQLRKRR